MGWLRHAINFMRQQRGDSPIAFALCLLPLCAVVGSTMDMNRQLEQQVEIKQALDIVVVSTARRALTSDASDTELLRSAQDLFDNTLRSKLNRQLDTLSITKNEGQMRLDVEGQMPTGLMRLVGQGSLPLNARSTAAFDTTFDAEIALVLDTSYSMKGDRMDALRAASKDMIDSMIRPENDSMKMSIIPFATYVNVGTHQRGQKWLAIAADETGESNTCTIPRDWYETYCQRETYACERDGLQKSCHEWKCLPGDLKNAPRTCEVSTWEKTWHGCVKSRPRPHNATDANYAEHPIVGFVADDAAICPTPIQPLTNNRTDLKNAVDALRADQNTYIAGGLIWGLRTLSANGPFNEGEAYVDALSQPGRKALVLMSDGANTRSPDRDGLHTGSNRKRADKTTRAVCEEIKSQGIKIYTIAFELDDLDTKEMLRECASERMYYFDAKTAEALGQAFRTISNNINHVTLID